MAKRNNYTNYGKMANQTEKVIPEEVKEELTEAPIEDVIDVEDILVAENPIEETAATTLVGVVSDCKQLNIRKEPDINSERICVVSAGAVLVMEPDKSTDEWFKVYTEAGIEGFCMKKFVTIK